MARIFEGLLWVHYSQAYVGPWDSDGIVLQDAFHGQNNGLCGAALPGALFLITGLHTGRVGFTVNVLEASPPLGDTWEEIVEVSFAPDLGRTTLNDWNGNCVCDIPLQEKNYGSVIYLQLLLQWRFGLKSVLLVENIHIQRL